VLNRPIIPTGEATAVLPAARPNDKPITVIGTQAIRDGFDAACLQQALNSRSAPGVTELVLNPRHNNLLRIFRKVEEAAK
jgi:tRNA-splicing ligase RtcB